MDPDPDFSSIPLVDIGPLVTGRGDRAGVIAALDDACRRCGFFYVAGHGIDPGAIARLDAAARAFFAQDVATKLQIRMALGGRAWRGYFPLGGELTSGAPDWKEGIYFGAELDADHPLPLHGRNLFPDGLREPVLAHMAACERLGQTLMAALGVALGHDEHAFRARYLATPFTLFRIFHYPVPPADRADSTWGVGEHTDYGLLTILAQDDRGGLEVRSRERWVDAPPIPDTFVCNLGDMLERLSGGRYRSTPHRVRNRAGRDRLSMPFFFDPSFDAIVPTAHAPADPTDPTDPTRWDGRSVHAFEGTYGDYLIDKVAKVFPGLRGALAT